MKDFLTVCMASPLMAMSSLSSASWLWSAFLFSNAATRASTWTSLSCSWLTLLRASTASGDGVELLESEAGGLPAESALTPVCGGGPDWTEARSAVSSTSWSFEISSDLFGELGAAGPTVTLSGWEEGGVLLWGGSVRSLQEGEEVCLAATSWLSTPESPGSCEEVRNKHCETAAKYQHCTPMHTAGQEHSSEGQPIKIKLV